MWLTGSRERIAANTIYETDIDLVPDLQTNTLTVRLHHLTQAAHDEAVRHLCNELNATETLFPGTDLKLVYQIGVIIDSPTSGVLSLRNRVILTVLINDPRNGDRFIELRRQMFPDGKYSASASLPYPTVRGRAF